MNDDSTDNDLEIMSRDELIAEVKRLRQSGSGLGCKGVRKQSGTTILGLPLVSIAYGPDPEKGEQRGHAKGIIAIGDIASGFIAIGGLAYGGLAIGGCAIGLLAFGGCALSLLLAVGGLAIGCLAFGGGAIGLVAVGGGAIGYYAVGGGAIGVHVIDGVRQSPEAVKFFEQFIPGLAEMLKPK